MSKREHCTCGEHYYIDGEVICCGSGAENRPDPEQGTYHGVPIEMGGAVGMHVEDDPGLARDNPEDNPDDLSWAGNWGELSSGIVEVREGSIIEQGDDGVGWHDMTEPTPEELARIEAAAMEDHLLP